jgi:hypothetical protein
LGFLECQFSDALDVQFPALAAARRSTVCAANDIKPSVLLKLVNDAARLLFAQADFFGNGGHGRVQVPAKVVTPVGQCKHAQQLGPGSVEAIPNKGHDFDAHNALQTR